MTQARYATRRILTPESDKGIPLPGLASNSNSNLCFCTESCMWIAKLDFFLSSHFYTFFLLYFILSNFVKLNVQSPKFEQFCFSPFLHLIHCLTHFQAYSGEVFFSVSGVFSIKLPLRAWTNVVKNVSYYFSRCRKFQKSSVPFFRSPFSQFSPWS